ncbi:hypothetical protein V495_01102 [Pseudogymnoascus sp. VKM F-4514 (FW-929)]|nr:hypothetical protein V495_01102 [Pseudogymnoascus sp. VKM F-4514 (FW-929)]
MTATAASLPAASQSLAFFNVYYPPRSAAIPLRTEYVHCTSNSSISLPPAPPLDRPRHVASYDCTYPALPYFCQSQFKGSGNGVLRLFEGVRGVRRARIFGSISEWPEYVAWLQRRMMSKEGSDLLGSGGRKGIDDLNVFPRMLETVQVVA